MSRKNKLPITSINDLHNYLLSLDVTRQALATDTATDTVLTICGMWRISKDSTNKKLICERLKVSFIDSTLTSKWVRTDKLFSLPLLCIKDHYSIFEDVNRWCLTNIMDDLHVTNPERHIKTITDKLYASVPHYHKFNALKLVVKKSWEFVECRPMYGIFRHIYHNRDSMCVKDIGLKEVNDFTRLKLNPDSALKNKSLLPLLIFIDESQFSHPELFSNKVFLPLVNENCKFELTKADVRILRAQPITFTTAFCANLNATISHIVDPYYNGQYRGEPVSNERQSSELQIHNLLCNTKWLLRNNDIMQYPIWVRSSLLRLLLNLPLRLHDQPSQVLSLFTQWAIYHKQMIGKVKPIKHKDQWDRVLNQLEHVIDWFLFEQPLLHKNQTWVSFNNLADGWTKQQQELQHQEMVLIKWEKQLVEDKVYSTNLGDIRISEICNAQDLHQEGCDLDHCVFSYRFDCFNNQYRVFSLRHTLNNKVLERATLGVHVHPRTGDLVFDQLRTFANGVASKTLQKYANSTIKLLNLGDIQHAA
ncbi:PcfJ domain-containing protein [Shewanella xiamenensis]|uniref:PcfJ domain-containing protein n=1 Tax=Shewanella xiamenensis TaxID=332186 RepID=UPI00214F9591|nr:PcfJ domain-containing protein [Shewanella xiamenensis]MCR4535541.1 PcfJ domain-containing protein [Shewanella xiamenensis]